jgi:tetratricopeptide (TPR) repeat protein
MGNNKIAMEYFSKALDLAKALGDERNISIAYESIGNTHKEMGNRNEALRYFGKALKIAKKQGNRRGEGILYGSIGDLYYDQRNYKLAFEYFHKALHIASDAQDRWSECIWRANIGALHMLLGEEQKGISFTEDSLEIAKKLRLPRSEKINLRELATARMRVGELDVAETLALQGLDLSRRTKDRQNQVWLITIIGIIAIKRGKLKGAISHLENAVKLADPTEDRWQLFRAKLFLMRARFLKKKSLLVLNEMRSMVDSMQAEDEPRGEIESLKEEEVATEAYITLSKCLREIGKREEATEYMKRAQALIDKYKLYSLKRELKEGG